MGGVGDGERGGVIFKILYAQYLCTILMHNTYAQNLCTILMHYTYAQYLCIILLSTWSNTSGVYSIYALEYILEQSRGWSQRGRYIQNLLQEYIVNALE